MKHKIGDLRIEIILRGIRTHSIIFACKNLEDAITKFKVLDTAVFDCPCCIDFQVFEYIDDLDWYTWYDEETGLELEEYIKEKEIN